MTSDLGGMLTGQEDGRGSADALSYSYDGLDRLTQTSATVVTETLAGAGGGDMDELVHAPSGGQGVLSQPGTGTASPVPTGSAGSTSTAIPTGTAMPVGSALPVGSAVPVGSATAHHHVVPLDGGGTATGTPAPTSVPTGAADLGGMDLGRYCHSLGDTTDSLDGTTASDWHCVDSLGVRNPINMTALCVSQYPSATDPAAYAGSESNPYSWQSYDLSPATATSTIAYTYDGVQRLTGAAESPGSSFAYSYDLAGNRTGVTVNGTPILTNTYDAADQVVGWTYDNAGNLTNDGTTSYSYDATNDLTGTTTGAQTDAYAYNGDGTLVSQTANGTTTNYTQDLAADQSQILAATTGMTTTDYLYGQDTAPLAALSGGTRTWYGIVGQGSVRQSLNDSGIVLGVQNYDPFGQIEAGSSLIGPFGYTGELQDATTGQEYLRARWYQPSSGTLLGVDPLLNLTGQPYVYAGNNPVNRSDPHGLSQEVPPTPTPTPPTPPNGSPAQPETQPLPETGTESIDQFLQKVADAWPDPVEAGAWQPGDQVVPFYIGTKVHDAIARYYTFQNRPDEVYTNYFPISTILMDLGIEPRAIDFKLKPDILNITKHTIYEIKPANGSSDPMPQLVTYIAAFAAAGVSILPGPSNAVGTSGVLPAPGGYVVFGSLDPGVILYDKHNGSFSPAIVEDTTSGIVVVLRATVDIVVAAFGIIIEVVGGSPASSGSPAVASWNGRQLGTSWTSLNQCGAIPSDGVRYLV